MASPHAQGSRPVIKGFKNFLMRGDVIVVAVGLVVALAFSALITAFTATIITPIINRFAGSTGNGLGIQLGDRGNAKTFLDIGGPGSICMASRSGSR